MHPLYPISTPGPSNAARFEPATKFGTNVDKHTAKQPTEAKAMKRSAQATRNPGRVRLPGFLAGLVVLLTMWLAPTTAQAQVLDKLQGLCTRGGQNIRTAGASSSEKAEMVVPSCTVTVYIAGTLTPATLYSDRASTPTPKANPFTANAQGEWFFYATSGRYDIRFSGGTGPGAYPAPVTYGDWGLTHPETVFTDYRGAINVSQPPYSCVGDGVTDDTACIQAAIDLAASAGSKIVYLPDPSVKYLVTGLTIPGGVTFQGDGKHKSKIYSATNAPILNLVQGTGDYAFFGPKIQDLVVEGNDAGSSQIGINVDDPIFFRDVVIENVTVQNAGSHGVSIGNAFSSEFKNIYSTSNGGYPFLYDASNMPSNYFYGLYAGDISAAAPAGFRIKAGTFVCWSCNGINSVAGATGYWAIIGGKAGDIDGDTGPSYAGVTLRDCNIEGGKSAGLYVYPGSVPNVLDASSFVGLLASSGNYKAIEYDTDPSLFPENSARGYIDDTVVFANSPASYYANSEPIHSDGLPPLTLRGRGPRIAGGAFINTFYNGLTLRSEPLNRADGYQPTLEITTSKSYVNPGPRFFRVNCAAPCTLTLPSPVYYDKGNEFITVLNISADGIIVTVNANGGAAVNGGSYLISTQNTAVQLYPDFTSLDWRVVSNRIGNGSPDVYALYNTATNITSSGSKIQNSGSSLLFSGGTLYGTDNTLDIGSSGDNRPRYIYTGTAVVAPKVFNALGGPCFASGNVTPEGNTTCEPGSIYLRSDGTWYQKTGGSGNTGWVLFTGGSGGAGVTSLGGTTNQITVSAPTGAVSLSLAGPHAFSTATTNGVAYGNGTGPLQFTAAGGPGTLCLTSTAGAAPVWGACAGSAATAWDALTAPGAGNLSLNMGTFLTGFSWATGTGTNNLFRLTTAAAANGTGYLLAVDTGAGSTVKPLSVTAVGTTDGIEMTTAGVLVAKGAGRIEATPPGTTGSIPYNNGAGLFDGAANAVLDIASSTIILGTSSSQNGQLQLRNSTNAFTTTIVPGVPGANNTLTLPATTDTLAGIAAAQTFTNKTITSSTNILGGVTMTLGSDADGDIYYRTGGVLTRLPKGTALQGLRMNAGATAPEWAAISASAALTATYVGYGDGANLLTGSDRFSWDNTNRSLTLGESGNAGQTNITLRSTNTSSALFTSSGAGRPGSQGGIIFDNVGGDHTQGPGLTWSNGNYNVTSRLYISLGLNWQGYDTAGQSLLIRKSTATSSQGTKVFELRPNDGYFEVSPFSTGAGNTTEIRQLELLANGTAYFATKAADSISTSYTLVWPTDVPVAGDRLSVTALTGSTITTEWLAGGGSGTVTNTGTLTSGKAIIGNGGSDITASRLTLTNPATTATFTLADNKTFTVNNSITFSGTDSTTLTLPAITDTLAGVGTQNTFTVQQTINGGTTSGADRLLLNVTALGSNGVRSSPNIIQRGSSYDGSAHVVDWRFRVEPTTNAGSSQWVLQSRVDAASFVTNLQIDDQGVLTVTDAVVENGNLVLNDLGVSRVSTSLLEINNTNPGNYRDLMVRQYFAESEVAAGTGNQTINKALFVARFAAAATSLTITNSLVSTSSMVICTVQTNDTTLKSVAAVPASGSVALHANAAATAETRVACNVFNN